MQNRNRSPYFWVHPSVWLVFRFRKFNWPYNKKTHYCRDHGRFLWPSNSLRMPPPFSHCHQLHRYHRRSRRVLRFRISVSQLSCRLLVPFVWPFCHNLPPPQRILQVQATWVLAFNPKSFHHFLPRRRGNHHGFHCHVNVRWSFGSLSYSYASRGIVPVASGSSSLLNCEMEYRLGYCSPQI